MSSLIVGLLEVRPSPLTTVSGPLVIATCAEFSVLILGRYLEERQRGLDPGVAAEHAARRTGRAFFTSAVATICGFAVLIGSALPLLRDFGILVTLNVAIAVLAALVVIPPVSIWADRRGWLGTQQPSAGPLDSMRLAAPFPGPQTVGAVIGVVGFAAAGAVVYATADTSTGTASTVEYIGTPLPTTTTTTPPTTVPPTTVPGDTVPEGPSVNLDDFPSERPTDSLAGTLFDLLATQGVPGNQANCAIQTLDEQLGLANLDTAGVLGGNPDAIEPVYVASEACGIDRATVDAALATLGGG